MNHLDEQAKEALDKRSKQESKSLKDAIWNDLENELFNSAKGEVKEMKKKKPIITIMIATAATLLIIFSLQTDKGSAFVKGIKDVFSPEKEIIQNIEGQDEEIDVNLNEGTNSEYVIYVDKTRYKMTHGDEADIITTIDPLPDKYPEVSMEIKQIANEKPEVLVKRIEAEFKQNFPELREIETVTEPVKGFLLHGIAGNQADSKVIHAYVINNGKAGSFLITERYFLEAAEGHGARFHRMLESFEIIE